MPKAAAYWEKRVIEEEEARAGGMAEEEWHLETEFTEYRTLQIMPPGRSERIKPPPPEVPPPLKVGSEGEQKARGQL